MFHPSFIVENFKSATEVGIPYNTAYPGNNISIFDDDTNYSLPTNSNIVKWIDDHYVTGLVILKVRNVTRASLLYENYYRGNHWLAKTISWSTGKSFVSALIGIAVQKNLIKSINDKVSDYLPQLINKSYGDVMIKNLLQMSSGIKFDEDYDNPMSDVNMMSYYIGLGFNFDDFIMGLTKIKNMGKVRL